MRTFFLWLIVAILIIPNVYFFKGCTKPYKESIMASSDGRFLAAMLSLWGLLMLIGLAFWGAVIYIVLHFVFKFW